MIYKTKIKTGMTIDHEREIVKLDELKIDVEGYENKRLEERAIDCYNKDEELKAYAKTNKTVLWYDVFEDMYKRLRYWRLLFRKKRKYKKQ